jgi:hypothetical protein
MMALLVDQQGCRRFLDMAWAPRGKRSQKRKETGLDKIVDRISSASSLQDFRVQALQFAAGVCYGHVPVHTTLGLVQVL